MDRRSCLRLLCGLGAVGPAGCLADETTGPAGVQTKSPGEPTTPAHAQSEVSTQTHARPDVSTPAPGECDPSPPPEPSTGKGLPDPRPYPDRPSALDPERVESFLEEYEAAYRYNLVLSDQAAAGNCLRHLEASVTESSVRSVENGVTGEIPTRAWYTGETCPESAGTDTPSPAPHADLPIETATYYVTDRFLLRDGTVVECWSE